MSAETVARILLSVLVVLFFIVRIFFTVKSRREGGEKENNTTAKDLEGRVNFVLRRMVILPLLAVVVFFYATGASWIRLFSFPMPLWVLWPGAFLGSCGLVLLVWVHISLGKEWSAKLRVRSDHHLVQTGPYARIRHPMYTALFAIYFSMGMLSSNFAILALIAMAVTSIAVRIPREEQMMIEKFGDEYRSYVQKTGRLFPGL
jgi:protein-S-isoprenylcysteine O-methyltransferase Ste14